MKHGDKDGKSSSELRARAEEAFNKKYRAKGIPPPEDNLKLIHELQVHQIELEMQNEELHRAQVELEASHSKYFELYNLAPVGYLTINKEGFIKEANLATAQMLGAERSLLIGQPIIRFIYGDDKDIHNLHLKKLFDTGLPQECELRLVKTDHSQFWTYLKTTMEGEVESGPVMCKTVLIDITDRKQAEHVLRESEERFRVAQELSPDGFTIFRPVRDEDGRVVDFTWVYENDAIARISGTDTKAVVGRRLLDLFPGHRGSPIFEAYKYVAEEGDTRILETCYQGETIQTLKWFRLVVVSMGNDIAILAQDVTERKLTEAELSHYRENLEALVKERTTELEEKNTLLQREITQRTRAEEENASLVNQLIQSQKMEALGRFAGGIAHDLNNFLYPVLLNTQMLLDQCSPNTSFHETLEGSLKSLYLQKDLIRQILLFSRKSEQKFSPVHVKPLLKETLAMLKSLIPGTVKVQQSIDCPLDLILGDPTQIQQIIVNLCSNAVDAMDASTGMIELKLGNVSLDQDQTYPVMKAGEYLYLSVKDSGCGMTEEILRLIFEPFFTTKEVGKGTGMGLSVIHGIVKSHGGIIAVESDYGKGSRFTVHLPLMVGANKAATPCR